jgi:hypothetical protein
LELDSLSNVGSGPDLQSDLGYSGIRFGSRSSGSSNWTQIVTPIPIQLGERLYSGFPRMRLIFEFLGPACPEPWLDELNLGPEMSVFSGLNLDVPLVAYSRKQPFQGTNNLVVRLSRQVYPGVLLSWLEARNYTWVGAEARSFLDGPVRMELFPTYVI